MHWEWDYAVPYVPYGYYYVLFSNGDFYLLDNYWYYHTEVTATFGSAITWVEISVSYGDANFADNHDAIQKVYINWSGGGGGPPVLPY